MKNTVLVAMSLCAFAIITTNQTHAQAKEGGGAGHSHFIKVPATVEEIWKEIGNQQTKLAAVVAKNDLGEAHDHGYAIRDLVRALPGKVAAESKANAEKGAAKIATLAAAIDKSSAAGAQKVTDANVKKLATAVDALRTELKAK